MQLNTVSISAWQTATPLISLHCDKQCGSPGQRSARTCSQISAQRDAAVAVDVGVSFAGTGEGAAEAAGGAPLSAAPRLHAHAAQDPISTTMPATRDRTMHAP
jgi:hypothetical protein